MSEAIVKESSAHQFERIRDLILILTQRELRVRYKSYALGYVWSLLNPLAFAALFYFVFQVVMKTQIPNYPVFLVSSLFAWQAISNSIAVSPMTFVGNGPLIKKVPFAYSLLPFVASLQDLIHYLISVPVIFGLLLWFHMPFSLNFIWGIPLLSVLQLALTFFSGLFIASLNLFFRDLERIVGICIMFLFYGSPIVYAETSIPEKYQWVVKINPVAQLVLAWRKLFMENALDLRLCGRFVILLLPIAALSMWTYRRLRWRFAEVL